jgi:SHS2 domain-containing protein
MYKFIEDLTSDVMFIAEAPDLASLLRESSLALFDVVCQRDKVETKESVEIRVEGETPEELVHSWLSRLLTESDANELFFSKFEVKVEEKDGKLVAEGKAWGEPYSQEKSGTVVKGVTYYNFSVKKTKNGHRTQVVCDI